MSSCGDGALSEEPEPRALLVRRSAWHVRPADHDAVRSDGPHPATDGLSEVAEANRKVVLSGFDVEVVLEDNSSAIEPVLETSLIVEYNCCHCQCLLGDTDSQTHHSHRHILPRIGP